MNKPEEELWLKKIKDSLKDYSEQPSGTCWNRLEGAFPPVAARRVRAVHWWAAAAVVVLAVSGAMLLLMPTAVPDAILQMPEPMTATIYAPPTTTTEPFSKEVQREVLAVAKQLKPPTIMADTTYLEPYRGGSATSEEEDQPTTTPVDDRRVARPSGKDKLHLPVESRKRSDKGRWAFSASVSNVPGASTSETHPYMMMADMANASKNNDGLLYVGSGAVIFDSGVAYLKESVTISEVKHRQPISFGLSVRRGLGHGFSVESGLTYTLLSSEGRSMMNGSTKIEQKLHYIGIPLRANYNFIDTKLFTAYATAGGMIEKCVYATVGSEKYTVNPVQFSLLGGVGAQLNVSKHVGIYFEPGISYFFDDGSDIETIRKETPLNLNLQAGLRLTY